jgi:SEC-C motif
VVANIFPTPGRNQPCHCGSGVKYKRCCDLLDQKSWRTVAQLRREVDTVLEMLRAMPKSSYQEYDPEP